MKNPTKKKSLTSYLVRCLLLTTVFTNKEISACTPKFFLCWNRRNAASWRLCTLLLGVRSKILRSAKWKTDIVKLFWQTIYCKTQFTSRQHNNNINYNSISINTQLICYMFRLFWSHYQAYASRTTVFQFCLTVFELLHWGSLLHYKS